MMQTPVRDCEPNDYQQLYRKHVHQNMLLHERLKQMNTVEKSKIRQLQNEVDTFRLQHLKYAGKMKKGTSRDIKPQDGKQCKHRSAYLVCKDFAYPARTWHELVDVTKPGLDLYKSEILSNTVGERPETQTSNNTNNDVPAYALGKPKLAKHDSLPTICLPTDKPQSRSSPIRIIASDEDLRKLSAEKNKCNLPGLDAGSPCCNSYLSNSLNVPTLNVSSMSLEEEEEEESDRPYTVRPDAYRRRSHTIDTIRAPAHLARRRSSLVRERSSSFSAMHPGKGWQVLKKKAKLISASLSLLHNARETEIQKTAKSFEDLRHCRYLRVEDDKSHDEGLDNETFVRYQLSSQEDLSKIGDKENTTTDDKEQGEIKDKDIGKMEDEQDLSKLEEAVTAESLDRHVSFH